ncbi:MAG: ribbon-helix-helix protein, CopG family [Deltaproteobacteria bacterium]|nr:MAG: ribbon-helix-helix protein, CopG family [Deltaproteobacteria bacterium]
MKTAISIPDDLFVEAERTAKRLGLSRSELYRRALATYLERHSERAITEALDAVYGAEPEQSALDREIERVQDSSLPREKW